jgi:hypothetical protein
MPLLINVPLSRNYGHLTSVLGLPHQPHPYR